ncbi:MAG: MBL fold metallo-hydrolase [Pseudomonadota bacterium]
MPNVKAFFDPATFSYSYVVSDPATRAAAVIDPVLDYDQASGRICTQGLLEIANHVQSEGLEVAWILETHVHADHLSAAHKLRERLGGKICIGSQVVAVQSIFGDLFNAEADFQRDGSQFDQLLNDGDTLPLGSLTIEAMATPGHTPACMTYVVDGAAFVGDTLFMPDFGTARTDFPGGDARTLYQSIQRILALPAATQLYMCHDYGSETRDNFAYLTTVAEERAKNVHIHEGVDEATFVEARQTRDAGLAAPRLLLPSVQFNMRAGKMPPAEDNGQSYFKIPIRQAS